jgi:beta-glucanase (GH16 family)
MKHLAIVVGLGLALSPASASAGWDLSFRDEFNGSTVDAAKWTRTLRWGDRTLSGNGEKQCYLEANVTASAGFLALTAKKQAVTCPKINASYAYTSGAIASFDKFSQAYGYFEMRAKLPAGRGLWPAFWLLPQSGAWPPEIDVLENLGHEPTRAYQTYHYLSGGAHVSSGSSSTGTNLSTGYHTFGVDWKPGLVVWYLDGREVKRFSGTAVTATPMYLLANLAVGGYWPGNPDATTPFPSTMSIDSIRVYQRVANGVADSTPPFGKLPSMSLGSPAAGSTIPRASWITLTGAPTAASRVVYYVDDVKRCDVRAAPYNCSYFTPSVAGSVVTIRAVAFSSSGVTAQATRQVKVR